MTEEKLTTKETAEYTRCNKIIKKNKQAFKACGEALATVLTQKLYRIEYDNFESYCKEKHGFKRAQAYRLMEAAEIADLSPAGRQIETEKQARALKDIPPEKHAEVIEAAQKNGKLSAPAITNAAEKIVTVDVIERDHEGHEIPTPAMATWDRRHELDDYIFHISKLRSWAETVQKGSDRFFAEVGFSAQEVYKDSSNLYRMLKGLVPWSICSACQGQAPKTCKGCNGRGMISKHSWDHGVDPTTKKMMKKKAEHDSPAALSTASR